LNIKGHLNQLIQKETLEEVTVQGGVYIYIYLFIFLSKSMETRHDTGTYTSSVWLPRKRGKEEKSYNKNFTRITTTNLNSQISLQLSATNLSADKFKFLRKFH
jgi:hypothetical protein